MGAHIVEIAKEWIGTPYHHQASVKGVGTDCLGLIRGVWRSVYGAEPAPMPNYSQDWAEPSGDEVLWTAALTHLEPRAAAQPGAVALFRMRGGMVAKHLGIVSQTGAEPKFIHAYMRHGVIESPLSAPWQRRVVQYFAFPQDRNT